MECCKHGIRKIVIIVGMIQKLLDNIFDMVLLAVQIKFSKYEDLEDCWNEFHMKKIILMLCLMDDRKKYRLTWDR